MIQVSGNSNPMKEAIMVDPLEAKRLAAIQMKEIQRRERFKRRRQIEAINGAWAMIGLTAGLVIEGHTGKSILEQVKSAPIDCIQFRSWLDTGLPLSIFLCGNMIEER
ncbi:hypothetical protein POTOM_061343 [Populus tomentosa]|uniref:Uncharacterized protein n=1 Tax=Populus tomentosa TaxID=118781 RepID=A0A8X7XQU1_POPTO|nr:hypothetical protein POTOM_061343 [Populus tomentosa]